MSAPRRVYVAVEAVARACGIPLMRLDNQLRPAHWGMPRDLTYTRAGVLYAEASLPQLVDALFAAGETDAALRLRAWITTIASAPPLPAEPEPDGVLKTVERGELTEEVCAASGRARRHRSDVEASPFPHEDDEL